MKTSPPGVESFIDGAVPEIRRLMPDPAKIDRLSGSRHAARNVRLNADNCRLTLMPLKKVLVALEHA